MRGFKLPENFLIGTATSSLQIEGGDTNNTWYKWCQEEGHIRDSSSSIIACDHWNRVEQDIKLMKNLNVQTYRMSLEWSRLEPSRGEFSHEAMMHYRNEIQSLLKNDIKPLVALHHFSEPLWFHEAGGWKKPGNSQLFVDYCRYVVENLGDIVSDWITFNEPNVYGKFGYTIGCWPPGERNIPESLKVQAELIKTHVKLYGMIHEIRKEKGFGGKTLVGAAVHIRIFEGVTFLGKKLASFVNHIFNEIFMEGITTGRLMWPFPRRGYRYKKGKYADFLGINYYTRNILEFTLNPANWFYYLNNDRSLDKSDLGWDIYPRGIYEVCKKYYKRYKLPIFITENGISDKADTKRGPFICDHLAYIAKAINEGIQVERYYYWTLLDNFEWHEGLTAKFGLYHCDFSTQERTLRKSGELFAEICKTKEITTEALYQYVKEYRQ